MSQMIEGVQACIRPQNELDVYFPLGACSVNLGRVNAVAAHVEFFFLGRATVFLTLYCNLEDHNKWELLFTPLSNRHMLEDLC